MRVPQRPKSVVASCAMRRTVELRVAGQNYRVVSSVSEDDLRRLAEVVSTKLVEVAGKGRGAPPQAMLLAAIALAHELESQRDGRLRLERRTRDLLRRMLARVDAALEPLEQDSAHGE
jgi:cell division protein ZapA